MDNKALLDELMGRDRDLPEEKKRPKLKFDDSEVCRYFLAKFCPHDLFYNTKSDLGPCSGIHDEKLRDDYQKSDKVPLYESQLLRFLERLVADLERRIKRSNERLEKEIPDNLKANEEKISVIEAQVVLLLKDAEAAGEEGDIEKAQTVMEKIDALNKEKDSLKNFASSDPVAIALEKERKMIVCTVCGAMQTAQDTEKRLASHYDGKQHVGYKLIRETALLLREKYKKTEEESGKPTEAEKTDSSRKERHRHRSPDRVEDRKRVARPRHDDRDRDRDQYSRDRDRRRHSDDGGRHRSDYRRAGHEYKERR